MLQAIHVIGSAKGFWRFATQPYPIDAWPLGKAHTRAGLVSVVPTLSRRLSSMSLRLRRVGGLLQLRLTSITTAPTTYQAR